MDNFRPRTAVFDGQARRDILHATAGIAYRGDRFAMPADPDILRRLGLAGRRFVTVHNGFDSNFGLRIRRATKCYPHFNRDVAILKRAIPDRIVVQIGTGTSEIIPQCDHNLLRRTTLSQVAGIIASSVLRLDNESGLVHLASCLGTRSLVVSGPTLSDYFGYAGNINIEPPVCGDCWWMTRTWMDLCAKGYDTPRCMTEQSPDAVAATALAAISGRPDESAPIAGRVDLAMESGTV
jgi:hypothetical protein